MFETAESVEWMFTVSAVAHAGSRGVDVSRNDAVYRNPVVTQTGGKKPSILMNGAFRKGLAGMVCASGVMPAASGNRPDGDDASEPV